MSLIINTQQPSDGGSWDKKVIIVILSIKVILQKIIENITVKSYETVLKEITFYHYKMKHKYAKKMKILFLV
jgi:hypothetical protein